MGTLVDIATSPPGTGTGHSQDRALRCLLSPLSTTNSQSEVSRQQTLAKGPKKRSAKSEGRDSQNHFLPRRLETLLKTGSRQAAMLSGLVLDSFRSGLRR